MAARAILLCLLLSLCACALPSGSVLLFAGRAPEGLRTNEIPAEWKGRLVRARAVGQANDVGGTTSHFHDLAHSHRGRAAPTTDLAKPLGIREVTADALHGHDLESVGSDPGITAAADHMPLGYGLNAEIFAGHFLRRPPRGVILAFVGDRLPAGWVWCDGSGGAPDLRERFVILDGEPGPSGAAEHSHDASHRHKWATAENPDRPGFFKDPSTVVEPSLVAAKRVHRHSAGSETMSSATTSLETNRPPSVALRFIMATADARRIPDGAVILFSGRVVPPGWKLLQTLSPGSIEGRLLRASFAPGGALRLDGKSTHEHRLRSRHEFLLEPEPGDAGRDRVGDGPAVPRAGHRHRVVIEEETDTASAEAMPRFVSLLLLVKS